MQSDTSAVEPDAAVDLAGGRPPGNPDIASRADLFRYLIADNVAQYRAVMELFTGALLVDLSAAEAAATLGEMGSDLSADQVASCCEQLEAWGNLVRGVRDARVPTVRDYLRSRARYQASKLGGRVHRDAEAILGSHDGPREVARELLGSIVDLLERITERLATSARTGNPLDLDALAGEVTTVFSNQAVFNESARDFYAYLNQVLTRYDLGGEEYQQFKTMLLEYIDLITADVVRHAPAIIGRFTLLAPYLPALLDALATLPTLQLPDGRSVDRMPGRDAADWEVLQSWYTGRDGRSGPDALRAAAEQALGQLITNAKRLLAVTGTGLSRRADLLKLAGWFDDADPEQAHRLYAATFSAYSSRHLLMGPEELSLRDGAVTSWWKASPVEVPLSLRDRGDRTARGRNSSVPDTGLDEAALLMAAEQEAGVRRAAAEELIAAGDLNGARVSPAARDLLMDRVGDLLAIHQIFSEPVTSTEGDLGLVLTATPTPTATVLHATDGTVTVHGLALYASAIGHGQPPGVTPATWAAASGDSA